MLSQQYMLTLPKEGDFLVDNQWHFEIGGHKKNMKQIYHKEIGGFATLIYLTHAFCKIGLAG